MGSNIFSVDFLFLLGGKSYRDEIGLLDWWLAQGVSFPLEYGISDLPYVRKWKLNKSITALT